MATPARLIPLLEQFDWGVSRLTTRMNGPQSDSGTGEPIEVPTMTDDEYFWEPVAYCWSVRRRSEGPGHRADRLAGTGEWGLDVASEDPWPPPFTTIAWRLGHLAWQLSLRADYTIGSHALTGADYEYAGSAAEGVAAFDRAAAYWREALVDATDEDLDTIGHSTFPYGSDAEDAFIDVVWWLNQEVLHHGAEIALLRDLYREQYVS